MNPDGSGARQLTDDPPGSVVSWSPDSRFLLFVSLQPSGRTLSKLNVVDGTVSQVYTPPNGEGGYIHDADWSAG